MSFLPPNASIDVTIPANQSIIIGSYGGGTAIIQYATDAASIPRSFYENARLTDAQATYGPFPAGRTVRINSGLCELEYSVGNAPFLTRVNKYAQDASGNVTGLVGPGGRKISNLPTPIRQLLSRLIGNIRSPLKKTVMATPPTILKEADGIFPGSWTTPLASAVLVKAIPVPGVVSALDSRFHFSAPESILVTVGNLGYNDGSKYDFLAAGNNTYASSSLMKIKFCTDSPYFGIALAISSSLMMLVDGEYVSATPFLASVSGSTRYYLSVSFAGARKAREITLIFAPGNAFGGLAVGPNDTVFAPPVPSLRITAEGDSYLQGASTAFAGGIVAETALALDADYFCAPVGGTGYVKTNGAFVNAQTRISQVTNAHGGKSDVVIVALGLNDLMDGTLLAGATAYYTALRQALPDALFVVTGTWCPIQTNGASYLAGRTVPIFAAVRAAGGPYILIDNISGSFETSWGTTGSTGALPWQTGTGKVGATTGSGNGDIYVSSDGTHANVAGNDYLAECFFAALQAGVNS